MKEELASDIKVNSPIKPKIKPKIPGNNEGRRSREVDYTEAIGNALVKSKEKDKEYIIDELLNNGGYEKVANMLADEVSLRA
jgi:hypothetical protein